MAKKKSIEISPAMIDAGVKVLRESGKLYCNSSSDDLLVREIVESVLDFDNHQSTPKSPETNS